MTAEQETFITDFVVWFEEKHKVTLSVRNYNQSVEILSLSYLISEIDNFCETKRNQEKK